jgi:hypothetical protein
MIFFKKGEDIIFEIEKTAVSLSPCKFSALSRHSSGVALV